MVNADLSGVATTASIAALGSPMQAGALVDADVKRVNGVVLQGRRPSASRLLARCRQ